MTAHRTAGAFAEYVTAAQASTALVSAGLDLATAGALDLAGTATLSATGAIDPLPGETVLISGAAGSVGVRRATRRGARSLRGRRNGKLSLSALASVGSDQSPGLLFRGVRSVRDWENTCD